MKARYGVLVGLPLYLISGCGADLALSDSLRKERNRQGRQGTPSTPSLQGVNDAPDVGTEDGHVGRDDRVASNACDDVALTSTEPLIELHLNSGESTGKTGKEDGVAT